MTKNIPQNPSKNAAYITLCVLLPLALLAVTIALICANRHSVPSDDQPISSETVAEPTPAFLDLQPVIDDWVATLSSNVDVGLLLYDLDHDRHAALYNPDEIFNVASIYKLFFVYDGYTQIDANLENADDPFVSDYTLSECLDLMVRESYNGCADPMRADRVRYQRVETLISNLGLTNTSSAGLYSTARDLTELLKLYSTHPDLSADSWAKLADSMLNQPATTYNWRQALPAGFQTAAVYAKVGWNYTGSYWSVYAEAALLDFPDRHYTLVVLTSGLPTYTPLTDLGRQLENYVIMNS